MAGWYKLEDESCIQPCNDTKLLRSDDLKTNFNELVSGFLKGTCGSNCFRPLPPLLGNGHVVDLLKLYFVVKQNGGVDAVTRDKLWDEVGVQCGMGMGYGSACKLIYSKYLESLESWLAKVSKDNKNMEVKVSKVVKELERECGSFVADFREGLRRSDGSGSFKGEKSGISFVDLTEDGDENVGDKKSDWTRFMMGFADSGESCEGNDENLKINEGNNGAVKMQQEMVEMSFVDVGDSTDGNDEVVKSKQQEVEMDGVGSTGESNDGENLKRAKSETSIVDGIFSNGSENGRSSVGPVVADDVVKSSENSCASKKCSSEDEELINVDSGVSKEVSSRKRKRDGFSGMLSWMASVAKDPTDPVIGMIPESPKWKYYGNDSCWKQVLLARQALFLKKIRVQSAELPGCQADTQGRLRQRSGVRLDMQPTASIYTSRPTHRVPVGKSWQAEVLEWTGVTLESDSKWLGTRVWPLEKTGKRLLIERDPIGKGRPDTCGCQFPDTAECVKFHVTGRRMKMKLELGSAFDTWNFNKMGEECSASWTAEEEKKFKNVVKANPKSLKRCFWKPMCKALPGKSWADLVNYYYNVFMLRRRGYQNRNNPADINSEDEETEYRSTANSLRHEAGQSCASIFLSKKAHTNK